MEGFSYATALALAMVFATAGTAKLRRRSSTARAFAGLGLASPRAFAWGVPLVELGLAAGLIAVPASAAIVALAVLAGFTTFVVQTIRRGDTRGCGCFGATRPGPMGIAEVLRNGLLCLAATIAAFASRPVVPQPMAVVVVAGAVAAGTIAVSFVARRQGPALARGQGPSPGTTAPFLPGLHLDGVTLNLVAFVAPRCQGCEELRATLAQVRRPGVDVKIVELDDGSASSFATFGVVAPPVVVVIDGNGVVLATGPARSDSDLERLVRRSGAVLGSGADDAPGL